MRTTTGIILLSLFLSVHKKEKLKNMFIKSEETKQEEIKTEEIKTQGDPILKLGSPLNTGLLVKLGMEFVKEVTKEKEIEEGKEKKKEQKEQKKEQKKEVEKEKKKELLLGEEMEIKADVLEITKNEAAYDFLEVTVNNLNRKFNSSAEADDYLGSVESDETISKKLKEMDIESFHFEITRSYKLNALMTMINLKDHYLTCLKKSVNDHLKSLIIMLKELEPYNEFCLSIKRSFKFLYDRNNAYKSVINNCQTKVLDTLMRSFFFWDLSEYGRKLNSSIVTFHEVFDEIGTLKTCIEEINLKYTAPFDAYIDGTTMYKQFVQKLNDNTSSVSGVESRKVRIDMFLKTFTKDIDQIKVNHFFHELFNIYTSTTNSSCFSRV